MGSDNMYKIIKGPNLRVLDVKGFDRIVFGCPPRIVKYFSQKKQELPAKYVLPVRTFMKGRNNFDFEFILSEGDIFGEPSNMKINPKSSKAIVYTNKVFAVRLESKQVKRMFKLFPSFYGTVYQKLRKLEF